MSIEKEIKVIVVRVGEKAKFEKIENTLQGSKGIVDVGILEYY